MGNKHETQWQRIKQERYVGKTLRSVCEDLGHFMEFVNERQLCVI